MRLATALMLLAGLASAGLAAASGGDNAPKPEQPRGIIGARVPSVYMPTLVAPVVVGGELRHYVFFSVTLQLTRDTHKSLMLEKIPYIQDAFVREVHGVSIVKDGDPTLLDEDGLKERLLRVSIGVVGPDIVKAVELRNIVQAVH